MTPSQPSSASSSVSPYASIVVTLNDLVASPTAHIARRALAVRDRNVPGHVTVARFDPERSLLATDDVFADLNVADLPDNLKAER